MHTSSILKAEDFEFWGYSDEGPVQMEFPRLCPGYAETDRVAIVSPWFEDGVVNVPLAILSMATAFYDVQRARGTDGSGLADALCPELGSLHRGLDMSDNDVRHLGGHGH